MEKYIGAQKVMGIVALENKKTPGGNEMVEVKFEDGTTEIMPKMRFDIISTDDNSDASGVQTAVQTKVGSTIFGMLHEFGIKMGEVEEVLNAVSNLVNAGYEKARDIKWNVPHRFLPLIDVNDVLVDYARKENTNGAAPAGGGADK